MEAYTVLLNNLGQQTLHTPACLTSSPLAYIPYTQPCDHILLYQWLKIAVMQARYWNLEAHVKLGSFLWPNDRFNVKGSEL